MMDENDPYGMNEDADNHEYDPNQHLNVSQIPSSTPENYPMMNVEKESGVSSSNQQNQGSGFCSCFTVAYYQPYFQVDTTDVIYRIKHALNPLLITTDAYFESLGQNPDAYGPFWLATTLIFIIAVSTNFNSWAKFDSNDLSQAWAYDFEKVVTCCGIVYSFLICVPIGIWGLFKYMDIQCTIPKVGTLYGYSLSIFLVAVSFLFLYLLFWFFKLPDSKKAPSS